jgi:hypothetical protein
MQVSGSLLTTAQRTIPPILEKLGLEPTNETELRSLILELQCARTLVALDFFLAQQFKPETLPKLQTIMWTPGHLVIHMTGNLKPEEQQELSNLLQSHLPGNEFLLLLTQPEEALTIQGIKEAGIVDWFRQNLSPESLNQLAQALQSTP